MTAPARNVRLQKFLSDAGVASRRHAEELILEGRVMVNDRVVDELPAFVDPRNDRVHVHGNLVRVQKLVYWIVHKPKGVVCTNRDPEGRTRAVDLLPPDAPRMFAVGRLDADSTGLLLMTNDGELAERLTHPRYGIPKQYRAEVKGKLAGDVAKPLRSGVHLAEGKAAATEVEVKHKSYDRSVLMVTLREGRNRQVRRMLARLGYKVKTLKRVRLGPLELRSLPVGAARELSRKEIEALRTAADEAEQAFNARDARRRSRTPGTAPRKRKTERKTPRRPASNDDTPSGRRIIS